MLDMTKNNKTHLVIVFILIHRGEFQLRNFGDAPCQVGWRTPRTQPHPIFRLCVPFDRTSSKWRCAPNEGNLKENCRVSSGQKSLSFSLSLSLCCFWFEKPQQTKRLRGCEKLGVIYSCTCILANYSLMLFPMQLFVAEMHQSHWCACLVISLAT